MNRRVQGAALCLAAHHYVQFDDDIPPVYRVRGHGLPPRPTAISFDDGRCTSHGAACTVRARRCPHCIHLRCSNICWSDMVNDIVHHRPEGRHRGCATGWENRYDQQHQLVLHPSRIIRWAEGQLARGVQRCDGRNCASIEESWQIPRTLYGDARYATGGLQRSHKAHPGRWQVVP
jgi:hypothetical protein